MDPIQALRDYGVDAVRWYLMCAGGSLPDDSGTSPLSPSFRILMCDSDYSDEQLRSHYNVLNAQIGNLVSRISSDRMLGKLSTFNMLMQDTQLDNMLRRFRTDVDVHMREYRVVHACKAVLVLIAEVSNLTFFCGRYQAHATPQVNKMLTVSAPWHMQDPTGPVVYAFSALRLSGILLQPIMPSKSAELLDRLGVPEEKRRWEDADWPAEVDAQAIKKGLENAGMRWRGKGFLFPHIEGTEADKGR